MIRRYILLTLVLSLTVGEALAQELPTQLSDEVFWSLVSEFSEEGGTFPSNNFVSNEAMFQHVIPSLIKNAKPGGVYLGVGPDQNFTYIVALQPRIAFIFDIRRQNVLQHLMYKALIELSQDRSEFLSRLFSRKRSAGANPGLSVALLIRGFAEVLPDEELFQETMAAIRKQLVEEHKFKLTTADERGIHFILSAFYAAGPNLTYSGPTRANFGARRMPTYEDLMTETDGEGQSQSYLASEENFRRLQDLERKNLVVPLVGDFAGDKAIRMVGEYLKAHGAFVSAFYLSNVEQYLFQQGDAWSRFYKNVGNLPLDSTSTFIRSVFNGAAGTGSASGFTIRSVSLLSSILDLSHAFENGEIENYRDVILLSN